jgi:tripartite-type tricarboxylate transporter receptor subunit TctC
MKKFLLPVVALVVVGVIALFATRGGQTATWKVTCPWAPSGVAAMMSQKAAALSVKVSDEIILVAEAIPGDVATVNTWMANTEPDEPELVFSNEGHFAIVPILDPSKLQFGYEDLVFVENLYSAIFVMSAQASLNIKSIADLQKYLENGETVSVAANGAVSPEAFLVAALFGSMGKGEQLKIVPYSSAAEAAQAVSRGETQLAISHQSQILETFQQGGVTMVCAFDQDDLKSGPFAGVEGVGKHGYPYFRNRCFVMGRAGADAETVRKLKKLYNDVFADAETAKWMRETMLIEIDPMTEADVKAHVENVKSIVTKYRDLLPR